MVDLQKRTGPLIAVVCHDNSQNHRSKLAEKPESGLFATNSVCVDEAKHRGQVKPQITFLVAFGHNQILSGGTTCRVLKFRKVFTVKRLLLNITEKHHLPNT